MLCWDVADYIVKLQRILVFEPFFCNRWFIIHMLTQDEDLIVSIILVNYLNLEWVSQWVGLIAAMNSILVISGFFWKSPTSQSDGCLPLLWNLRNLVCCWQSEVHDQGRSGFIPWHLHPCMSRGCNSVQLATLSTTGTHLNLEISSIQLKYFSDCHQCETGTLVSPCHL